MVTWREALRWLRQGQFVNLPDGVQWFGLSQAAGQWTLIGIAIAVFIAIALATRHLAAGRFVYAVGSDAEAARLAGIRPQLVTFGTFMLMGAIDRPRRDDERRTVATGGSEIRHRTRTESHRGSRGRWRGHIPGGRGNLWGVFLGLLLLACVAPALTHLRIEAYWEKAIQGAIILLAVVTEGLRRPKEGR